MLINQTKDQQTSKTMDKLKEYRLNIDKMTDIDNKKPEELLYGSRIHNRKAEYIKNTSK